MKNLSFTHQMKILGPSWRSKPLHYQQIIVDADLCNKLGDSNTYPYLCILLPLIADKIFIHQIVYDEILQSKSTKEQIERLITDRCMFIVDELSLSPSEMQVYTATYCLLESRMMDPRFPRKNRGEVCSLAYAKTKSIPIFATDEKNLQTIIDSVLNAGMQKITCLRIEDIVKQIKEGQFCTLGRKDAKLIWAISGKKTEVFNSVIWPLG